MTLISWIYLRGVSIMVLSVIKAFRSARLQDLAITQSDESLGGTRPQAGRAARREDALPYGGAGTVLRARRRAIGSAGERLVHTEEVTGSIPVSPTDVRPDQRLHGQLSSYASDGSCRRIGRNLGDCPSPRWLA